MASGKDSPHASCLGASRFPLLSILGPKTLCGVGDGPEDCSPVPTWNLGYFWSLLRGVSPRLDWGPPRALSSRVEMGMLENFLTCSKGVKDPFYVPEVSCD